jgi:hypothetical protein
MNLPSLTEMLTDIATCLSPPVVLELGFNPDRQVYYASIGAMVWNSTTIERAIIAAWIFVDATYED